MAGEIRLRAHAILPSFGPVCDSSEPRVVAPRKIDRMARRNRPINLPAPYLRRLWLDPERIADRKAYPFCLPFLQDAFELSFDKPITIIVGENGTGKSTLLEGIAVLAGYDEAGGGKGYRPVDHSNAVEVMG